MLTYDIFSIISTIFIKTWWVFLFFIVCFIANEQLKKNQKETVLILTKKLNRLYEEEKIEKKKQENLRLKINSQSDPLFIELVLMKVLGVVPEGQIKVYFKTLPSPSVETSTRHLP